MKLFDLTDINENQRNGFITELVFQWHGKFKKSWDRHCAWNEYMNLAQRPLKKSPLKRNYGAKFMPFQWMTLILLNIANQMKQSSRLIFLSRHSYIWAWCWSTPSMSREHASAHIKSVHLEGCLWYMDRLHRKAGHSSMNSFKLAQALVQIGVTFQHQSRRILYQLKNLIPNIQPKLNRFSVPLSSAQIITRNADNSFFKCIIYCSLLFVHFFLFYYSALYQFTLKATWQGKNSILHIPAQN